MRPGISRPKDMTDKVQSVEHIYEFLAQFLIAYSFQLLGAVLVLVAGVLIAGWVAKWLLRLQEKRNVDPTLRQFIASAVRLLLIGLAIVIALGNIGISITPLIAAIGGLAVGASLALQGPISNYGAGLIIILTRVFRVGDTITVRGQSGIVRSISLGATVLAAEDAENIVIPNRQIAGEIHRNSFANRIIEGKIGIANGEDIERAIMLTRTAIRSSDGIAADPPPQIGIESFGEFTIQIGYRIWVPSVRYFELLYRVNSAVLSALTGAGIQIGRRFSPP
jgi:small conductance mechanosensitive channel